MYDIGKSSCSTPSLCIRLWSSFWYVTLTFLYLRTGHEDDMVIELANEVRKVLGIFVMIPSGKKLVRPSHMPLKPNIQLRQLHSLQEAVAMDS